MHRAIVLVHRPVSQCLEKQDKECCGFNTETISLDDDGNGAERKCGLETLVV